MCAAFSTSPDRQGQSGDGDLLILKRKLFRPQWPERKLQRKKGNLEEDKIEADSTEGKNKRVWAPVFVFCQAAFQRESISDRKTLFLCRPRGMPAGASDARILAEIPPATCNDEGGRRAARVEMDLFRTVLMILRCRGRMLARMRAASVDVDLNSRPMVSAKGRWADFRTAITRFLRMAEAQTEQLYSIVGITRLFYIEEKLHCARGPKTADSILE
jgi:hypothetical protein